MFYTILNVTSILGAIYLAVWAVAAWIGTGWTFEQIKEALVRSGYILPYRQPGFIPVTRWQKYRYINDAKKRPKVRA